MPKIQQSKEKQFRITIPLEIMKLKGWKQGTSLVFNMQQNGEINIQLDSKIKNEKEGETTSFSVYLTDLYANINMDYSYGPRYFESRKLGLINKTLDLKIGEYNLIFENSGLDILVEYSVSLIYPDYPFSQYVDWALAFVDIGVSMLLVGLTLYMGIRA